MVLFQACPLAPIPAACKGCFSHPCEDLIIIIRYDEPDPAPAPHLLGKGPAPTASGTEGPCVCETPPSPALGSGCCRDESARSWLGAERGWPSPAYLTPQECRAQRGSSALLRHPGVLRAAFAAPGSGRLWESREKLHNPNLCPVRPKIPAVGSVHPVYVIPAGPSKKGSCKDTNSRFFVGIFTGILPWSLCWVRSCPQCLPWLGVNG